MTDSALVLAVANQKGGVGKTTTVINLGASLANQGYRTLLVDVDPQCNTSRSISLKQEPGSSLYEVLTELTPIEDAIAQTSVTGLDVAVASSDLAGVEVELLDVPDREGALKRALGESAAAYRYVILDCPPSLGLLTINALVAAGSVIMPVQCEYLALEGVSSLVDTIGRIRSSLNPELRIFGLVMTMYDRRTVLSDQVASEVRRHYPQLTFNTMIPRNVRLGEAPSFRQTIVEYDPTSSGAVAYANLAAEVVARG